MNKNINQADGTKTKVFALGGLGEIGKNMYCVMHKDELIIIDAGVKFPEDSLLGIDSVIPDYTFLKNNEDKIKALFITHGHEDHIGGITYLLSTVEIPVIYAPKMAVELIKGKLDEKRIRFENIIEFNNDSKIDFDNISLEFFNTSHSIPDSYGMAIRTPNGLIVETGDFKFDNTPVGPMADIHKMARLGSEGVTLLMSESTNALSAGVSTSESVVDDTMSEIFKTHNGRIIIATFASNVYRVQHIVSTCKANGRKIALFGRSMIKNVEIAKKSGYIEESNVFASKEEIKQLKPHELCILCTGSQGESLAALSRMANGTDKQVKLLPDDLIIFSSSPIPGNAAAITKTINKLYLQGVKVYTNKLMSGLHTSGHGNVEELKWMLRLMKPKYFMPIHGEYRMLKAHTDIAVECDVKKENTFIMGIGDVLEFTKEEAGLGDKVIAGDTYIDGNRIGNIGGVVLKDRKIMAQDGILVVIFNLDMVNKKMVGKTMITTRGFVLVNENEKLLNEIENKAKSIMINHLEKSTNYNEIKTDIIKSLSTYITSKTGRNPLILPVLLNINNTQNKNTEN